MIKTFISSHRQAKRELETTMGCDQPAILISLLHQHWHVRKYFLYVEV